MTSSTRGSSTLEMLTRRFRPMSIPRHVPKNCVHCGTAKCGVYLLVEKKRIVYVGGSIDIELRLCAHIYDRNRKFSYGKNFDSVFWYPLPEKVIPLYEGAFIRGLRPRKNLAPPPRDAGYDAEILEGFDLGHLVAELRPVRRSTGRPANRQARKTKRSAS